MAVLSPLCIGRRTDHIPFCVYVILFPYCVKRWKVRPLARPLAFSPAAGGGLCFFLIFKLLRAVSWSFAMKSLHVSGRTLCVFDMTRYYTVAIGLHVLYERIALCVVWGLRRAET